MVCAEGRAVAPTRYARCARGGCRAALGWLTGARADGPSATRSLGTPSRRPAGRCPDGWAHGRDRHGHERDDRETRTERSPDRPGAGRAAAPGRRAGAGRAAAPGRRAGAGRAAASGRRGGEGGAADPGFPAGAHPEAAALWWRATDTEAGRLMDSGVPLHAPQMSRSGTCRIHRRRRADRRGKNGNRIRCGRPRRTRARRTRARRTRARRTRSRHTGSPRTQDRHTRSRRTRAPRTQDRQTRRRRTRQPLPSPRVRGSRTRPADTWAPRHQARRSWVPRAGASAHRSPAGRGPNRPPPADHGRPPGRALPRGAHATPGAGQGAVRWSWVAVTPVAGVVRVGSGSLHHPATGRGPPPGQPHASFYRRRRAARRPVTRSAAGARRERSRQDRHARNAAAPGPGPRPRPRPSRWPRRRPRGCRPSRAR